MRFLFAVSLSALFAGWTYAQHTNSFVDLALRQADDSGGQPDGTADSSSLGNETDANQQPQFLSKNPQALNMTASQCNETCYYYSLVEDACTSPHCGCNATFLAYQGYCGLCQTDKDLDAATVQLLIDAETAQCRREGVPLEYHLHLSAAAQSIVDKVYKESAVLRNQQSTFLGLQIAGGHIGLPIVLVFAVFSRKVRRDPTFLNFCITWIFSSVVFSLELYRGTTDNTIVNSLGEVPPNKCLAQAALTEGAQVMTACATLTLVIRLWLGLRQAIYGEFEGSKQNRYITATLLLTPYVFFVTFGLATVFVGMQHFEIGDTLLQRAIPTNFYCTVVQLNPFIRAVYGVTLGLLIITMLFDVHIILILWKHWFAFRHVQAKSAVSLSLLLRVILFSVYRIVVAVAYGSVLNFVPQVDVQGEGDSVAVTFSIPVWVDMLQAAIPLVGTFVLGISSDMVATIAFWRKNRDSFSSMHSISTSDIGPLAHIDEKAAFENDPQLKGFKIDV